MTPLTRPAYLAAVAILVVNDVWLKYAWPGFVTGKLSDVAGLFAFAVFAACVTKRPALACIATGVAFVIWKSPLVEPLIANSPFSRVPDPTDLFALAVLPFAYRFVQRDDAPRPRFAHAAIAVLSIAAFANTSVTMYDIEPPPGPLLLHIALSPDETIARLKKCGLDPRAITPGYANARESLHIHYKARDVPPPRVAMVMFYITREPSETILEWVSMSSSKPWNGNDAAALAELDRRLRQCLGDTLTTTSEFDQSSGNSPSGTSAAPSRKSSSPAPVPAASRPVSDTAA